MKKLLLVVLASSLVLSSLAQTGRIAHLSHGGSAATLAAAEKSADNFGQLMPYFEIDSILYVSDSTVLKYGKWRYCSDCKGRKNPLVGVLNPKRNAATAARYFKQSYYHKTPKLVGFDSLASPVNQGQRKPKSGSSEQPAGRTQTFPKRPFQYSYWRGLAGVVALGAVGWLLGKKRPV